MANFCTKCGNPLSECTCQKTNAPAKSNFMTIRDYFGIRESDNHLSTSDCFERNKEIVPDLIKLSEGEYPIKQFEVGRVRSRSTFSWGYSRIQVTNKRLIQRTVGRSAIGKDIGYNEYAIDDIIGLNYTRGKQFSGNDFMIIGFIALLCAGLGLALGLIGIVIPIIITVLSVGFLVFMLGIQKQSNNFLLAITSAFTLGTWIGSGIKAMDNRSEEAVIACSVFALIFLIITFIFVVRFALLPSISLIVRTKSFQSAAAAVATRRLIPVTRPETILPGKDSEKAVKEIGAIITDVQTIGDAAVEKWRQPLRKDPEPRQAAPAPRRAPAPQQPPIQMPAQQDIPMQRPARQAAPAAAPQRPVAPQPQMPSQPAQRPAAPVQQRPVTPAQPAAPQQPAGKKNYDFDFDFNFDIDNL